MVWGLILFKMRFLLTFLICVSPVGAMAQDLPAPEPLQVPELDVPRQETPRPDTPPLLVPPLQVPPLQTPELDIPGPDIAPEITEPDYSKLPPLAERAARLEDLFEKLAARTDAESANLVAEEIWAIWLDSGSASVNLVLRRGSDASAKGNPKLARTMYNHAVDLDPNYAEAWARSARLALEQKDFNRALNETVKTLAIEPRHFYALWTMGNVFEALNRPEEALEAYREANRLYPELKAVKDRLAELERDVEGTVL